MKKIIFLIIGFQLFSCSTIKNKKSYDNELRYLNLDNKIENVVRAYRKRFKKNTVVMVTFKNKLNSKKKEYYVNRISSMSIIYYNYISYYSSIDGIPVIISSKKDGFINPNKYSNKFISNFAKYVNDDMLKISIEKDEEFVKGGYAITDYGNIVIDHAVIWKVKRGIIHKNWAKHPAEEKVLIENLDIDLLNFYRVIKGGIDDRKNEK